MESGFEQISASGPLWVPCLTPSPSELRPLAAGTLVHRGQPLVASHPSLRHLPVAPVDGTVGSYEPSRHGGAAIEVLPANPPLDATPAAAGPTRASGLAEAIERLRQGGVWADRWSSPDLIGQLDCCLTRPTDLVICNLLDLDASLPVQLKIAAGFSRAVVDGLTAVSEFVGAGRCLLAVPDNLDETTAASLLEAIRGTDIRLMPLSNRYPLSNPSLLLHALTGRVARFGVLPSSQGAVVLDAAAAKAVGDLFSEGRSMTHAPIALFNRAARAARYLLAPVGMSLADLLPAAGSKCQGKLLSAGTPLHERPLDPQQVVGGGECCIYVSPQSAHPRIEPCIRCAWCIEACPVRIQPAALLEAAQRGDRSMADAYGLSACIECGICSVVCPSRLPLLGAIRHLRRDDHAPNRVSHTASHPS